MMHYENRKIKLRTTRPSPYINQLQTFHQLKPKNAVRTSQSPQMKIPREKSAKSNSKGKQQKPQQKRHKRLQNKENEPPQINVNLSQSYMFRQSCDYNFNGESYGQNRKKVKSVNKQDEQQSNYMKRQPLNPVLHRKDLNKCQVHDENIKGDVPRAKYFVEDRLCEFLCCQQCLEKTSLSNQAKVLIICSKNPGKSLSSLKSSHQEFSKIITQIGQFQKMKEQIEKHQLLIRQIMKEQLSKHSEYYRNFYEIIRSAQQQSEEILTKTANECQQNLTGILNSISSNVNILKQANKQLMQSCAQNKVTKQQLETICREALDKINFDQDLLKIELRIAIVDTSQQLVEQFKTLFYQSFRVSCLLQHESLDGCPFTESIKNNLKADTQLNESLKNMPFQVALPKNNTVKMSDTLKDRKNIISESLNSDRDLLCEQSILSCSQNSNNSFKPNSKPMLFSFEHNPYQFVILEQSEEEQSAISPVFKHF